MKRKGNINPSRKIYFDAIQLRNKIKKLPFAMTRHCKDRLSIMLCHLMNVIVANSINNILALEPYWEKRGFVFREVNCRVCWFFFLAIHEATVFFIFNKANNVQNWKMMTITHVTWNEFLLFILWDYHIKTLLLIECAIKLLKTPSSLFIFRLILRDLQFDVTLLPYCNMNLDCHTIFLVFYGKL